MPHQININELETGQIMFLLKYWQKIKLVIEKVNIQIDDEFKELLQYLPQLQKDIKILAQKSGKEKSRRREG